MTCLVEVVFNYECHVRKRQVDKIAHDDPVVSFIFYSVAVLETKLYVFLVKVRYFEAIALKFAAQSAIDYVVFLSNKGVSMAVLEEKSIYVDVERLYLLVKVQIPYYEAVLSG